MLEVYRDIEVHNRNTAHNKHTQFASDCYKLICTPSTAYRIFMYRYTNINAKCIEMITRTIRSDLLIEPTSFQR